MKIDHNNFKDAYENLSEGARELYDKFEQDLLEGTRYKQLKTWQKRLQPHGISFDYGLDSKPFDLKFRQI